MQVGYGTTENSPVTCQGTKGDPIEDRVSTVGNVSEHTEVSQSIVNDLTTTTTTQDDDDVVKRAACRQCCQFALQAKVVNTATGRVVPRGEKGELLIRGYCVMLGYWEAPEQTAEVVSADRWYSTG